MKDLVLGMSKKFVDGELYTLWPPDFFSPKLNMLTWLLRRKDIPKLLIDDATDRMNCDEIAYQHSSVQSLPNLQNLEINICFTGGDHLRQLRWCSFRCIATDRNFLPPLFDLIRTCELGLVALNITFKVYSEDCRLRGCLVSSGLLPMGKRKALIALEAPPRTCEQRLLQAFQASLPKRV